MVQAAQIGKQNIAQESMVSFKKRSCTVLHHQKTALLVQQHTTSSAIEQTLDVYVIDDATLKKIDTSKASDTEKVFNLIKIIEKTVEQQGVNAAYLVSIAEKAELLVKLFENRQKTTKETLEELKEIVKEMNATQKEQVGPSRR